MQPRSKDSRLSRYTPWILFALFLFSTLGIGYRLWAFGVPMHNSLLWGGIAIAILLSLALSTWQGWRVQDLFEDESRRLLSESSKSSERRFTLHLAQTQFEHSRSQVTQNLIATAILLAFAFGLIWAAQGNAARVGPTQVSIDLSSGPSNQVTSAVRNLGDGGTGERRVRFRQDLEDSLKAYLSRPQAPNPPPQPWWRFITWPIAIGVVGVALAIALTARHRPAAAAVIGTSGLAEVLISNFDHLSKETGAPHWWACLLFAGGLLLITLGAILVANSALRINEAAIGEGVKKNEQCSGNGLRETPHITAWLRKIFLPKVPEGSGSELLFSFGFSLLLLAWAMRLGPNKPSQDTPCVQNCVSSSTSAKVSPSSPPTSPAILFDPGKSDIPSKSGQIQIGELEKNLGPKMKKGDMLLLFGSADCTKINHPQKGLNDNRALALRRASTVMSILQTSPEGLQATPMPLAIEQANGCGANEDLRAVTPFLIHAETVVQSAGH